MILEEQVASLELSKRLKELGVKQESAFYWADNFESMEPFLLYGEPEELGAIIAAAFTIAELGEMLPQYCWTYRYDFGEKHPNTGWHAKHNDVSMSTLLGLNESYAATEANARAKMLVYLIERGIVKP